MLKIYHNPRCSKSRQALAIVQESGQQHEIIEYLKDIPTHEELRSVIDLLGIKPEQLLRKGEAIFKEEFKGRSLSDSEWIDAMVSHPKLIERPIVVKDGRAVIGRPPESVKALL